jgi:Putative metal-binding motif
LITKSTLARSKPALLVLIALGVVTSTASAAPPINDDYPDRLPLQIGFADRRANAEATVEAGEKLTPEDPGGLGCGKSGTAASGGIQMGATMWWEFTGTGKPITVSTLGSNFDTVLAVYEVTGGALIACNDDLQPADPTRSNLEYRLSSEIQFDSVAGAKYAVQVGACVPAEACGKQTGEVVLRVSEPPANDSRAAPTSITAGAPVIATNTGATLEPGEVTHCGEDDYAKTVWFRYTAPRVGTAAFSAAGFNSVLAVYGEDSPTPLGCNNDLLEDLNGASRWPMIQPPEPPVPVVPGDYLIQVGGYYDVGFTTVAARNGPFTVQVEFEADLDLDDDGVNTERDCDEGNTDIRPGVPEVPNNDVDDNCDGFKAYDRDGDGTLAPPLGDDCRDDNPAINPRAAEVRGNRIDENCDTETPDFLSLPTRAALDVKRRPNKKNLTWIVDVYLAHVKARTQVEIRCFGHRCGFPTRTARFKNDRGAALLPIGFALGVGEQIVVRTSKPDWIGHEQTFRVRMGKKPVERMQCLSPDGSRRAC